MFLTFSEMRAESADIDVAVTDAADLSGGSGSAGTCRLCEDTVVMVKRGFLKH